MCDVTFISISHKLLLNTVNVMRTWEASFRYYLYMRLHIKVFPYLFLEYIVPDLIALYNFLPVLIEQWLAVVSLAVFYNVVFVVGRAVFWEINRKATALWWTLDYVCDFIYLVDTLVHCHEGKSFSISLN